MRTVNVDHWQKALTYITSISETVTWRCFVKKVPLKILQNSQENTCVVVSILVRL